MVLRLCCLVLVAITSVASVVCAGSFTENFDTHVFDAQSFTTADWDTASGELRLFEQVRGSIGQVSTPDRVFDFFVDGDRVYVADPTAGLVVIDVTDPSAPTILSMLSMPDLAYGVYACGSYAYVTARSQGLQIVDVSIASSPVVIGSIDTPGSANDVVVDGEVAYVVDFAEGLQLIDVSDPTAPMLTGSYDTPGLASRVAVDGFYAYVVDGTEGLQIIETLDPSNPVLVATISTPDLATNVAVFGNTIYFTDRSTGVLGYDITYPSNPNILSAVPIYGVPNGIDIAGNFVFVAHSSGIDRIDVSDRNAPVNLETLIPSATCSKVQSSGQLLYLGEGVAGLEVFDIADPAPLVPAAPTAIDVGSATTHDLAIAGEHAYAATAGEGIFVLDISNPASPVVVGSYDTPWGATGLDLHGDRLYVADNLGGILMLDVSDPTNPTPGFSGPALSLTTDVDAAGRHVYVTDQDWGLHVYSTSNLTGIVGSVDTPGEAVGVVVLGTVAYVADGPEGFHVIDVSDPTNPTILTSRSTFDYVHGLTVSGQLLLVAGGSTVGIYDLRNPVSPNLIEYYNPIGTAVDVAVSGNLALVAEYDAGVKLIDISDPAFPLRIESHADPYSSVAVAFHGHAALLGSGFGQIRMLHALQSDVDRTRIRAGSVSLPAGSHDIARMSVTNAVGSDATWWVNAQGSNYGYLLDAVGEWVETVALGNQPTWTAELDWSTPGVIPSVSELTVEWRTTNAEISAISDVPGDQGGRVYLDFVRSGYDFAEEVELPIAQYGVFRRVDDPLMVQRIESLREAGAGRMADDPLGLNGVLYEGGYYVLGSAPAGAANALPEGTWASVATVPALQQDGYLVEVTTAADSTDMDTQWSHFVVTAHTTTPSVWFSSDPESAYSVDNLAPNAPTGLFVHHYADSVDLDWNDAPESDFRIHRVYRGSVTGFTPSPANLVAETVESAWTDLITGEHYYKVSTLDHAGNESEPAGASIITGVDEAAVPRRLVLEAARPNPFNPRTTLTFTLPVAAAAQLTVYDLAGRRVVRLVDSVLEAGRHEWVWDGTDDHGKAVASGVYLVRLEAGGRDETQRVVLVR